MRMSLVRRGEPLDRRKAWACLVLNIGACPGLGSVLLGRLSGWPQLALSVVGFLLMVKDILLFVIAVFRAGQVPSDWRQHLASLAVGAALFGAAWVWSGITSLLVLRSLPKKAG